MKYVVFVIMTYVSVLFTRLRLGTHYNVVMLGTPGWVQRFIIVPSQLNCIVAVRPSC